MKNQITPEQLKQMLKDRAEGKDSFLLVDVREQDEYDTRHIEGTDYLIPMSDFEKKLKVIQNYKEKKIILYCRASRRSLIAQKQMFEMGYKNVYNMLIGIIGY